MRITTGRSLIAAAILIVIAWCAAFAVRPLADAMGASMSHRPPLAVALVIYFCFAAHILALGALIVAAVSGLATLARDPKARTVRGISLCVVSVVSLSALALFVWVGILHRY